MFGSLRYKNAIYSKIYIANAWAYVSKLLLYFALYSAVQSGCPS